MGTINELAELTTPSADDLLLVREVSEVSNKDKRMALSQIGVKSLPGSWTTKQTFNSLEATTGQPKTSTTGVNPLTVSSNDGANPLQMVFGLDGGATAAERIGLIQVFEQGVTYDRQLQLNPFGGTVQMLGGVYIGASGDLLSVYDQGTYPPVIQATGGNPTISYAVQQGRYTRIGDLCFFHLYLHITTISGGAGDARVTLPILASSANGSNVVATVQVGGVDFPGTPMGIGFNVLPGTPTGYLYANYDAGAVQGLALSSFGAGDSVLISGFYFV